MEKGGHASGDSACSFHDHSSSHSGQAEPIARSAIRVVDGDTIEAHGSTFRMVDYVTPGKQEQAGGLTDERAVAKFATERFQELKTTESSTLKR